MNGKTVLLVEDNLQVMKNNTAVLRMSGVLVLSALTLAAAREHMRTQLPDAAVIDIMLPDGSGLDLLRELRERDNVHLPVLLLTARGDSDDVVNGLELGADDYLAKPYDLNVFEARVAALLRRSERLPDRLRCGALTLNITANTAYIRDLNLRLTQKEFALLLLLAQNPQQMLSAYYLYERAWGEPALSDNPSALRIQMSNLKRKLAQVSAEVLIETSRGEGYCLTFL